MRVWHGFLVPVSIGLLGAALAGSAQQRTTKGARERANGAGSSEVATRLDNATAALQAIMASPDQAIPQDLLDGSECIVVVPGLKKGAFVVGAQYGKGFLSCRQKDKSGWTAPANVRIEGGSFGFQIGGEETDVVMLVMNEQGRNRLLQSKFTLGAGGSVSAGPVGRAAGAKTDAMLTAEILSYSRSRGVFAGVSLEGATLREDTEDNRALYGRELSNQQIINTEPKAPAAAAEFVNLLNKLSPRETK